MRTLLLFITVALTPVVIAQTIKLPPSIEKLADIAEETVDVTMDASMLQFTERLLSDRQLDQARAKRVLRNLKAVYIKTYEFAREGMYSRADVDSLRSQLRGPDWSRVVEVRSRRDGENVDVFMRTENGEIAGIVVICSEPRELTIVDLAGPIRPEDLRDLRGVAGIPKWNLAWRGMR
jgi:hypothetical protein